MIALVRHAPVRFPASRWIWPADVRDAVADYNQAPILPAGLPHELASLAQSASVVLASSLARSIHTAELLVPDRAIMTDSIYDEAALPFPSVAFPVLPVGIWFIVLRVLWLLGLAGGAEPKSRAELRAQAAAERLVQASRQGGLVMLVGHGIFLALMSRALEDLGWRRLAPVPAKSWSACCFEPPAP